MTVWDCSQTVVLNSDWTERDFVVRHVHPIIGCPFTVAAAWLRCCVRAWGTVSKVETLPTNSAISRPRRPGIDPERHRWLSRTSRKGAVCCHTIFPGMHVVIWNACWHGLAYVPHVDLCNMHVYMSTCNTLTCQKHATWILNMFKKIDFWMQIIACHDIKTQCMLIFFTCWDF